MLEALRSQTLADGVENSLLEYIRGNNMQIGDTLPKEKDLAESLGVSRHIVREGISRLKALGLVESRKKRGMVMKRPCAFEGMRKLTEVNLFQKQDRKELIEMRVALEIGMTDFIYAHKTPERIAALRKVAGVPGSSVQDCETEIVPKRLPPDENRKPVCQPVPVNSDRGVRPAVRRRHSAEF